MHFRSATQTDISAIARLHAESWRRSYRGAYSDEFLDGDVFADRLAVWTDRLTRPDPDQHTVVADADGAVIGFVHTALNDDPTWGALLDNLHVVHGHKGSGIGTRLMAESAKAVIARASGSSLYLWVLELNTAAQAFYDARGGECVGRKTSDAPGGGEIVALRYVWRDPSTLL
jgi:ribosomal protein S18 acetylase RimI-like enzyme